MVTVQDRANRWPITVAVMLATAMQSLDTTIANVALPSMAGELSAGAEQITWVLTSYIVAAAVMTPLTGWLANRLGRKRVFLSSIACFVVASMLCGGASSLMQIVVFRFVQGLAGAALVPLSQAELLDIHPREKHAQAMAIWTMGTMVAPVAGPLLGGYLTDSLSWRWCFYINLPVGLLALLGLWTFMSSDRGRTGRRFDFLGYAMLALSLTCFQLVLDRGPHLDWFSSSEIRLETSVAASAFWIFIVHSLTTSNPFFNPRLFADRNYVLSSTFFFITALMLFGILAILPLMTQNLLGYPVLLAGWVMAPRGVGSLTATPIVGHLAARLDPRVLLLAGLVITGFATWQMTHFDLNMSRWAIIIAGLLQGVGLSCVFIPLIPLSFATLPGDLRADGSAINALLRNLAGGIGIALMQFQVVRNAQTMHASIAGRVDLADPLLAQGFPPGFDPATPAGAVALNGEITRQATMVAYVDVFWLMTALLLLCLPLLALMRPSRSQPPPEEMMHAME